MAGKTNSTMAKLNTTTTAACRQGDMSELGPVTPFLIPQLPCPKRDPSQTWREKARRAGMGTRAAMKKAIMLLTEVRATLVPVRFRHSPVRSCGDRGRG